MMSFGSLWQGNQWKLMKIANIDRERLHILWTTWGSFLIGIHSMQGWTATLRHGVTRERSTKWLKHAGNLFRKNLHLKDVC